MYDGVKSVPTPAIDIVDLTGEGDASNTGFAFHLHENMYLCWAIASACLGAQSKVTPTLH